MYNVHFFVEQPKQRWHFLTSTMFVMCCLAVCPTLSVCQQPRIPAHDDEVLERLPTTLTLNRDRMASIRARLAADPSNAELAAAAAQGYIKMGNDERDPRFYGYARAAITKWWNDERANAAITKTRAKLKEKNHEYLAAIIDLERLLVREPRDAQAWVELINLYRVVGEYDKARSGIQSLGEFADGNTVMVSQIPVMATTGKSKEALALLATLEANVKEKANLVSWIKSTWAGIEVSLGNIETADSKYREALEADSTNVHLKRTYAEFLLDNRHPAPVISLLQEHENDNGCLLLMAVAAKRTGQTELVRKLKPELETRFREIRLRGSRPHGRFESLFELVLNGNPERALEIALENWHLQKEIRDSRIVLECATVAKNPDAAKPVIDFLKESQSEDVALRQLIRGLEQ